MENRPPFPAPPNLNALTYPSPNQGLSPLPDSFPPRNQCIKMYQNDIKISIFVALIGEGNLLESFFVFFIRGVYLKRGV